MFGLTFLLLMAGSSPGADFQVLRILYTSDLHGRTLPSVDFAAPGLPRRSLGGWAGLARLVDSVRTDATLLVDCGDFAFGSPEADSEQGRTAIRFMNQLHYDAAVPGARDFLGGAENLEVMTRAARFPVLADPMLDVVLRRQVPLFRPYVVKSLKGIKVAVIGITDPDVPVLNRAEDTRGLAVDPPLKQLVRYLPAVRAESAEVIVVIGHVTPETGCAIADSFKDVNLIICRAEPGAAENRLAGKTTTPVVSAGAYGQRLGVIDVLFHKLERRVYQSEARVLNVEPSKPDLSAQWAWLRELKKLAWDSTACYSSAEFLPDSAGRLNLALLVAEAARQTAGADVAVLPFSVVDAGLKAGEVTRYELFASAPFRERLRLLALDDTALARLVAPDSVGRATSAPAIAGADYFIAGDTDAWPQVTQVARARVRNRQPGTYRVVTTEQWLEQARVPVSGRLLADDLTDLWLKYAAEKETLAPAGAVRLYPATPGILRMPGPGPVNINTANAELLCTLPGIGPKTAERIIEYRQTAGRFKSTEDILNVKGIGPKKMEKLRPLVTVR
jgi:competence ComEA-like helix-hairpin-helix protein